MTEGKEGQLAYSSSPINDDKLWLFSLQRIIYPFKIIFSVNKVFKFHSIKYIFHKDNLSEIYFKTNYTLWYQF